MVHADVTSAPLPSCFPPSFWVDVGLYRGEPGVKCDMSSPAAGQAPCSGADKKKPDVAAGWAISRWGWQN